MPIPGVEVTLTTTPPTRATSTETGPAFFAGICTSGVTDVPATKVQSLEQFVAAFGVAFAGSALYDAVDIYFREGGSVAYISRVHHLGTNTGIVAADYTAALTYFPKALGPGQVAIPGNTTLANQQALIAHALANNRVALVDGADSGVKATVLAGAAALNAEPGAKFAAFFGNWLTYPAAAPGTFRTVPGSAAAAALMARNDRRNSPNVPAAGDNGTLTQAVGPAKTFTDTDAQDLNTGAVNLFREIGGVTQLYGYRSLALKASDPNWWMFNHARLFIGIVALTGVVADGLVFAQIDGQRKRLAQFEGDLVGELLPLYNAGSLYGDTPDEAFIVDAVSLQANPDAQLAQGIVRALIGVRMSPFAELVQIQITKVLLTEEIAA